MNNTSDGQDREEQRLQALLSAAYPPLAPSEALRRRVARLAADRAAAAEQRRAVRWRLRTGFGFAATAAAVVLLALSWPRLVAAQALREMDAALEGVRSARNVRWEVAPDGRRTNKLEYWFRGTRVRCEQESPRRISLYADGRLWVYEPALNKVTVRRQNGFFTYNASGFTVGAMQRDIARWGWKDRIRALGGETVAGGRKARRVSIERDEPAGPTRILFLVDAETDLPFRYEVQLQEDGRRWVTRSVAEMTYDEALPARLFEPDFPRSARVFDRDAGREAWRERLVRGVASRRVGDRTIVIRDLQVNTEGDVFLLFTAGKRPEDSFRTNNRWAGRDWELEIADAFGTQYLRQDGGEFQPVLTQQHRGLPNGYVFDGERLEGAWWTPVTAQSPWRPRRFTITFRVNPVNLHGSYEDEFKADYSETAAFTIPVERPEASLLPDYMPYMAFGLDEDTLRKAQADARGVLPPGVAASPQRLRTLAGNTDSVSSLAFAPDGRTLASGAWWKSGLRLWDAHTGRPVRTLAAGSSNVGSVAFRPDGRTIACTSSVYEGRKHVRDDLQIWDARTGRPLWSQPLPNDQTSVSALTFSRDGKTLIGTGYRIDEGKRDEGGTMIISRMSAQVKRWDARTARPLGTDTFPHGGFRSVLIPSQDGIVTHATVIENGRVVHSVLKVWDRRRQSGTPLRTITGPSGMDITQVAVSPDGKTIAGGGRAGSPARPPHGPRVLLWDARTSDLLQTIHDPGVTINGATERGHLLNALAFSPDGRLLAGATDDKSVKLWDARSGRLLHTLIGHGKQVTRVAFSPDGKRLASGDLGGGVNLWRVP